MQRKADSNGFGNTPNQGSNNIQDLFSSGAFSYASPPERVLLSDTTNMQDTSPFSTKFTILKFNSANKSGQKSAGKTKSNHSNNPMKPQKLLDLKVDEQILGKGIFSAAKG